MCFFDFKQTELNTQMIDGLNAVVAGGSLNAVNVITESETTVSISDLEIALIRHNIIVTGKTLLGRGVVVYHDNKEFSIKEYENNEFILIERWADFRLSGDIATILAFFGVESETKVSDLDNEVRLELFASMRSNLLTHEQAVVDAWAWGFEFSGLQSVACAGCGRVGLGDVGSSARWYCTNCMAYQHKLATNEAKANDWRFSPIDDHDFVAHWQAKHDLIPNDWEKFVHDGLDYRLHHAGALREAIPNGWEYSKLKQLPCYECGRVGLASFSSRNYLCDGCIPF